jgi:Fic family protein
VAARRDRHPPGPGRRRRPVPACPHPSVRGWQRPQLAFASTVCLYRAGYDFKRLFTLSEFYDRDRAAFYAALQGARRADLDLTGWLEYFIEGLSTQLQEVRDRGEGAIRADVIARERGLNARQSILLSAFLSRRPMTLADCEALLPDVVRRTVQRDLRALVDEGLLREIGRSPTDPTRHYVLGEL